MGQSRSWCLKQHFWTTYEDISNFVYTLITGTSTSNRSAIDKYSVGVNAEIEVKKVKVKSKDDNTSFNANMPEKQAYLFPTGTTMISKYKTLKEILTLQSKLRGGISIEDAHKIGRASSITT